MDQILTIASLASFFVLVAAWLGLPSSARDVTAHATAPAAQSAPQAA